MTPRARRREAQRRTVGRWIDDLIRSMERKAAASHNRRATPVPPQAGRPPLRLRRDLNLVLGL